ncbi:hypothetical protein KAW38_00380 [Candidatus Micrarchaeota archaeon]|nr:hypothetical protein [Candidatus Micrarchaeota archaeon]
MSKKVWDKEPEIEFLTWVIYTSLSIVGSLILTIILIGLVTFLVTLPLNYYFNLGIDISAFYPFFISLLPFVSAIVLIVAIWAQIGSMCMPVLSISHLTTTIDPGERRYILRNSSQWPAEDVKISIIGENYGHKAEINFLDGQSSIGIPFSQSFKTVRISQKEKKEVGNGAIGREVAKDVITMEYQPVKHPELRISKKYHVKILEVNRPSTKEKYYSFVSYFVDKKTGKEYEILSNKRIPHF